MRMRSAGEINGIMKAIMLNLAFQLIEAPVRRGDCGGRAIQGRKLGGVFRFPDLRLSSEELVG